MYLDKRSKGILEDLISQPSLTSKELEAKTSLTRRQIKYSVEKINNWLDENSFPQIRRLNNGKFIINPTLFELYSKEELIIAENYIPSEEERVLLIIFILISQSDLSLVHFTQALKVSNVTVLSDIKQAQLKVNKFQLEIVYSRIRGYQLKGDEWNIRNLLFYILQEINNRYGGLALIQDFALLNEEKVNRMFTQLEKIEEFLKIKFTDEKVQLLPYCVGIVLERVKRGNIIKFDFQIQYKELSDTKEYAATEHLIKNKNDLPEAERLYIALQLLSTNIFSREELRENELPQLKQALLNTLKLFEIKAFVKLKNKTYLVNKLMLHLKPAYYRIKYNLTSFNDTKVRLDKVYYELDHIVENSLQPLEEYINCKIPPNERIYLTLFIGGHLIETKQIISERKKAVVICRNGVTVSKLLRKSLTQLFPEFDFYQTMSLREFNEKKPVDISLVFSPEPIHTEVDLFIVNPLLSELDKRHLRQRVMKRLYGLKHEEIDMEQLLSIIEKFADIHNKSTLISHLQDFFFPLKDHSLNQKKLVLNPDLSDLLTINTIQITKQVDDWKDAIYQASLPLLENQTISESYIKKMIESHDYNNPYMVLGKQMAIPHASPEQGVNKLGMSLLIIEDGVLFSQDLKINFVVVIAPTDTEQHVKSIYQLSKLATNEQLLKEILFAKKKSSVVDILKAFQPESHEAIG